MNTPTSQLHTNNAAQRAPFATQRIERHNALGVTHQSSWGIAVEAPVEIAVNGVPWTVMLATPADVEDLAVGIALTERVLRDAGAIERIEVSEYLHDVSVNIVAPKHAFDQSAMRSRSVLGSTACGLCGLESLAQLHARSAADDSTSRERVAIDDHAIRSAVNALASQQPLNAATRSVHAAAWCTTSGEIVAVREDVGRHNALDKLIGALARQQRLHEIGFIVMSSRCSYELVYKAAKANTQLLATISAPTTMALEWAAALSLPLVCCSADADIVRFPVETQRGS